MKPLRIGPIRIIIKTSDITYEIVNQDDYTSHIHTNHFVPYYPEEPIIFPFKQQYNPHSTDDDNDNNDSNINDPIKPFDSLSDEEQSVLDEDRTFTISKKETDIPSIYHIPSTTIEFQPESFNQYSPFPYQQNKQKTNNTNSENQCNIHDYDNYINYRRHTYDRYNFRPQPQEDYRLFLGEKDTISFPQNPGERKFEINGNR